MTAKGKEASLSKVFHFLEVTYKYFAYNASSNMVSKDFFGFLDEMWINWGYRLVLHLECFRCAATYLKKRVSMLAVTSKKQF